MVAVRANVGFFARLICRVTLSWRSLGNAAASSGPGPQAATA
eukprot:CAMPEP_0183585656 /NCGR_PEP_ID=MMETSP0371-20130417/155747_1 /TAXON_ID=268820 /ORGANISM="Peridinium aciculiferum, Strain PAER-2" /LENGTH=41 /DNA_ID= /DNA_START= /DNA_END= /DNA_ORIENTATION=